MKTLSSTIAAAICLMQLGCQTDPNRPLIERELRLQEDEIYHLQGELDEMETRLESTRRENESLKKELGVVGEEDRTFDPSRTSPPPGVDTPPPPRRGREKPNGIVPPMVDPGTPAEDVPLRLPSADGSRKSDVRLASAEEDLDETPTDLKVKKVTLSRRLTGGHNSDGKPGDEGIIVFLEPRNAAGQIVPVAAEVSIALIDPAIQGPGARFARWDFATDETVTHFRKTPLGRGLNFTLPWADEPPKHRELKVYVRYITPEGLKLIASQEIVIDRPGDSPKSAPGRWTKAPPSKKKTTGPPADATSADVKESEVAQVSRVAQKPAQEDASQSDLATNSDKAAKYKDHDEETIPEPPMKPRRPAWSPDR